MSRKISEFEQVDELQNEALIPVVQVGDTETNDNFIIKFSNFVTSITNRLEYLIVKVINNLTSDSATDALSAAQGKLLNENKVDKIQGKGLSTNDFTSTYKTKLEGIQDGAQKNQNLKTIGGESLIGTGNIPLSRFGEVADNLTTFRGDIPLSAKQGVYLNRPATVLEKGLVRPDGITIKVTDQGVIYTGDYEIKSYKTFIFKKSYTEPATPNINDNSSLADPDPSKWVVDSSSPYYGWVDYPTDNERWWMSTGVVNGETSRVTSWSVPLNVSGIPGKDGLYTEFRFAQGDFAVYPRFNQDPTHVNAPNNNSLWTITVPTGVPDNKTIWLTKSLVEGTEYGEWSIPVKIKGEDGKDGINVEYIYKGTADGVKPNTPIAPHANQDQDIPSGWTGDPTGISSTVRFEWMSYRNKVDNVWGAYKEPLLWSYYAMDGKTPNWYIYIFKNAETQPATPTFDSPYEEDWINPDGWQDGPGTGLNWWMSIGTVNGSIDKISSWATPILVTGEKGDGGDYTDFKFGKGSMTTYPTINVNAQNPGTAWKDTIDELGTINYTTEAVWMTSARNVDGVYEKWNIPKRVTGEDGIDGKGVEFIFKRTTTETPVPTRPVAPVSNPALDDNYPVDWTDNQQGVTSTWRYEWVSKREKTEGSWGVYSIPTIWARYAIDGANGKDGQDGQDGEDGKTYYFHIRYSVNANGNPMITTPAKYIGTLVDENVSASSDYTKYTWYDWKGAQGDTGNQGIPGTPGSNGQTSYVHFKYGAGYVNNVMQFTTNSGEDPGDWLGQYTDFTLLDSTDPSKYTWSYIKGPQGNDGTDGTLPIYMGDYDNTVTYTGGVYVRHIVEYDNGSVAHRYIAKKTAGNFVGILPTNAAYWDTFDVEYDAVATKLLLADNANLAGWIFTKNTNGESLLKSQDTTGGVANTTLNGTTGEITTIKGNIGGWELKQEGLYAPGDNVGRNFVLDASRNQIYLKNKNISYPSYLEMVLGDLAPTGEGNYSGIYFGAKDDTSNTGFKRYRTKLNQNGYSATWDAGLGGNGFMYYKSELTDHEFKMYRYLESTGLPTAGFVVDTRAVVLTDTGKLWVQMTGLPTSSSGLVTGQIWNDNGTLKIVS